MSIEVSLGIMAISQLLMLLALIVLVAGVIWALVAFRKMADQKIDEAMARIQPVVDQAKTIAEQTKETTEKVSDKVDSIMIKVDSIVGKAESTADTVSDQVKTVSCDVTRKVESAISPPVVAAAGVLGTVAKFAELYRDLMRTRAAAQSAVARSGAGPETTAETEENVTAGRVHVEYHR